MSLVYSAQRGFAMGAKYGLVKGFRAYHSTEATPELDETAMQGAIGIIIAVGGVLIALYIIAVVIGSISYAVSSGNIKLSTTWNTTIAKSSIVEKIIGQKNRLTKKLRKTSELPNGRLFGRDYRFAGTGNVQPGKCPAYRHHRGGNSYDRYWSFQWPRHLSVLQTFCKTAQNVEYIPVTWGKPHILF